MLRFVILRMKLKIGFVLLFAGVVFAFKQAAGFSLEMSGSAEFAALQGSFKVNCILKDGANITGDIEFWRANYNNREAVAYQQQSDCSPYIQPRLLESDTLSCGRGTNSLSPTKEYVYKIGNVKKIHNTTWWCVWVEQKDNVTPGPYSNNYTLEVRNATDETSGAKDIIINPLRLSIIVILTQLTVHLAFF